MVLAEIGPATAGCAMGAATAAGGVAVAAGIVAGEAAGPVGLGIAGVPGAGRL